MNLADCTAPKAVCGLCSLHARRLFTRWVAGAGVAAVAGSALAQNGGETGVRDEVGRTSRMAKLVPAEQVEGTAAQQYQQMTREYSARRALAPPDHPQVLRLRAIAHRIIPYAAAWNERARQWRWEVNLLVSGELNAFCMPGGKIAFYSGILKQLQLDDDEVAAIMGHEMAHALREHARERMGKGMATRGLIDIGSAVLGLGQLGRMAADGVGQLVNLKFSRDDETEADIVGMDLAARAGYNPAAGVALWQKMLAAHKGAPPQWISTHPASTTRIRDIQARLPKVQPLYDKAAKPSQRYAAYPVA
jgi:Zn-dependent protease with chaperone function